MTDECEICRFAKFEPFDKTLSLQEGLKWGMDFGNRVLDRHHARTRVLEAALRMVEGELALHFPNSAIHKQVREALGEKP